MKKITPYIIVILAIIGIGLIYALDSGQRNFKIQSEQAMRVKIRDRVFRVEIADTEIKIEKGLSGRKKLDNDAGMLFIFAKPDRSAFWMKGMKFPLDFLWIRGNYVVDITKNAPPEPEKSEADLTRYYPAEDADRVLEINSGLADKYRIQIGDVLEFIR